MRYVNFNCRYNEIRGTLNRLFVYIFLTFSFPLGVNAAMLFSEIAWMGTDTDANNEWIELYNDSDTAADVTDWSITLNGESFITLAGVSGPVPAHGVIVLERTDDDVVPGNAFQLYTGALANTGGTLQLKDSSGNVLDTVIGGTNWTNIGGSNVTGQPKQTPQRTSTGSWVTGTPTPGSQNVQSSEAVPESSSETPSTLVTQTNTTPRKSSGGTAPKKESASKIPDVLSVSITAPNIVYVNQSVTFEPVTKGVGATILHSLKYTWNFGDTYTESRKSPAHTFTYPGEYVVVIHAAFGKQSAMARHEITVLPASFVLSYTTNGNLVITNTSSHEVDLGGFTLQSEKIFIFPRFTILKAGGKLVVGEERIGKGSPFVTLKDAAHTVVASLTNSQVDPPYKSTAVAPLVVQPLRTQIVDVAPLVSVAIVSSATPPTQTYIQIGNTRTQSESDSAGIFTRTLQRVGHFFGL